MRADWAEAAIAAIIKIEQIVIFFIISVVTFFDRTAIVQAGMLALQ
jgi:hypothetical protein